MVRTLPRHGCIRKVQGSDTSLVTEMASFLDGAPDALPVLVDAEEVVVHQPT